MDEDPTDITVKVIDVNDNDPVFTENPFLGSVKEASAEGTVPSSPDQDVFIPLAFSVKKIYF